MNTQKDALDEARKLFVKKTPSSREEALLILKRVQEVRERLGACGCHSTAHALHEAYSSDVVFVGFVLNVTFH